MLRMLMASVCYLEDRFALRPTMGWLIEIACRVVFVLDRIGDAICPTFVRHRTRHRSIDRDNAAASGSWLEPLEARVLLAASVGDLVWLDADPNAVFDNGEHGVAGVTVKLFTGAGTAPLATTTTNSTGNYVFNGLNPGNYFVEFLAPLNHSFVNMDQGGDDSADSDAAPTTGRTAVFSLATDENKTDVDAGLVADSLIMTFDYSRDTNNFFNTQMKRDVLQSAADSIAARFNDDLTAIISDTDNVFTARFDHPATGVLEEIEGLLVAANELIIFAGGRALGGPLGIGGPGGFGISFISQAFADNVKSRGEAGALLTNPTDFGPFGGAISFDTNATFHFGETTVGLGPGENDFFSIALHELAHLLGFGTADSFDTFVDTMKAEFTGAAAVAEFDGAGNPPLQPDLAHWQEALMDDGQETVMDPSLLVGSRKVLTELDFAALDDYGWDVLANLPQVHIQTTDSFATEAGPDTGTFTITRIGSTTGALTVQLGITGSAVNGTDYQNINSTAVIPDGAAQTTIIVTPNGDVDVEGDETVMIAINTDPAYAVGASNSSMLMIVDDDMPPPEVTIAATDALASEGGDTGTFTVTRNGSTSGSLTVQLNIAGTATNGTDYQNINNTVVIPDGASQATITVTPIDDVDVEGDEQVLVSIVADVAYTIGAMSSDTVDIVDDDQPPQVTIAATDADASESGDTGTFTVTRIGTTTGSLMVQLNIAGTAINGADYQNINNTVVIPDGASQATITVTPIDDVDVEGDEQVLVSIAAAAAYTVGAMSSDTVTIVDNDELVLTGSISDFVWHDLNGDGVQNPDEPGINGVTVNLLDGNDLFIATTTTATVGADDGIYNFNELEAGDYIVEFELADAFTVADTGADDTVDSDANPATGRSPIIDLAAGEDNDTVDAGLVTQLGQIHGTKFHDLNANGVKDDNEPGLDQWTIFLDTDNNGSLHKREPRTKTDSDGNYSFVDLEPGTYIVREVAQAGFIQSAPQDAHEVVITSNETVVDCDFGNADPTVVFNDDFEGVNPLSGYTTMGQVQVVDDGTGNMVVEGAESSDAVLSRQFILPVGASTLTFDYRFTGLGIEDEIVATIDDNGVMTELFRDRGADFVGNDFVTTPELDISAFAGETVTLEIRLASDTQAGIPGAQVDAVVEVDNIAIQQFVSVDVGDGANRSVTYKEDDGTIGIIVLKTGVATVFFSGNSMVMVPGRRGVEIGGTAQVEFINVVGSTTRSTLAFKARKSRQVGDNGFLEIGSITTDDSFRAISGKNVMFMNATITIPGTIRQLVAMGFSGSSVDVQNQGNDINTSLSLSYTGDTTETIVDSAIGIKSIKGGSFVNTDPTMGLHTPWLGSASFRGEAKLGLDLDDQNHVQKAPRQMALGRFRADTITGGTWMVAKQARSIVAGAIDLLTATFNDTVRSIKSTGHIANSNFTAERIDILDARQDITDVTVDLLQAFDPNNPRAVAMRSFRAGRNIERVIFRSANSVTSVLGSTVVDSTFFIAVEDAIATDALPGATADFVDAAVNNANAQALLGSFRVKGGKKLDPPWMNNVRVSAPRIGSIAVGFAGDSDAPYGLAATGYGKGLTYRSNQRTRKFTAAELTAAAITMIDMDLFANHVV